MKKIVLFIDDDIDDHEFFVSTLLKYDNSIKVVSAFDGFQAFTHLRIIQPLCIFLDINMPTLNGIEVLKLIKTQKEFKKIPVYIYSTSDAFRSKQKVMELGAEKYFSKPETPEKLEAIFKEVFGQKKQD